MKICALFGIDCSIIKFVIDCSNLCSVWYLLVYLFVVVESNKIVYVVCVCGTGKMKPVFCGNFEYDARESDLERLFRKYGKVQRVDMKAGKTCLSVFLSFFFVFLSFFCGQLWMDKEVS